MMPLIRHFRYAAADAYIFISVSAYERC